MDGLLVIDKPAGWTSHDVVARARRLLRERRVGHTGTLDPFATGVLVLLVGRATRLAQFLAGAEKEYEAVVRLGYATETGDRDGSRRGDVRACGDWGAAEIEAALKPLRGEIEQVPPMYSAKKVQGQKLYELARRGVEVERAAARVTVRVLEAVATDDEIGALENGDAGARVDDGGRGRVGAGGLPRRNEDGTCDLSIRVVCSAGTYVRALAESIGGNLGVGAHLAALRRTRAGACSLARAVSLERLGVLAEGGEVGEVLVGMNAALSELPAAHLTGDEARKVAHGATVSVPRESASRWADGEQVRLCDASEQLLAVGVYDRARGVLQPRVTLAGGGGAENKR
ncbi:MAG: tRNA pseudouridine(55) synthase TruB [Pyrinomonadaceae bacterium]